MENNPHNVSWFWSELKRRKVIRVFAAYIASAFLLIELVLITSPHLNLPSWLLPLVFVLLGIGFILSLWVSWVYDKTSTGIVKTSPSQEDHEEKEIPVHEWKVTTYISLVVIVALVIFHVLTGNRRASQTADKQEIPVEKGVDSDHVYLIVEEMPQFTVEGYRDFKDYINSELIYPETCRDEGISGRVYVQFTVKSDGSIDDVKVVRGINDELNAEAIRVVQSSPRWKPGKLKGKAVNVSYSFPVVFSLDQPN